MKKKYRIVLIVIACLFTGCRDMRENEAGETLQEASEYAAGMQTLAVQKETVRPETEVMEENIDKTRKGSGSITYEKNVEPLEKEQEQLLMEYTSLYYEALATLKPLDVGHLFSDSLQAEVSEGGAALQVELRKMQEADYEYYREEAVAYAMQYVGARNSEWPDYTGHGGNCQNYASQCLLAGGIPMDITGEAVWKWYGSEVAAFISYAIDNTGNGLVAEVDAAYYKREPGDLIHMGTEEGWRHTVMITGVIRNEKGEVLDYLVHSNTADIKEFPASLYGYPKQMLTKIYGWNG